MVFTKNEADIILQIIDAVPAAKIGGSYHNLHEKIPAQIVGDKVKHLDRHLSVIILDPVTKHDELSSLAKDVFQRLYKKYLNNITKEDLGEPIILSNDGWDAWNGSTTMVKYHISYHSLIKMVKMWTLDIDTPITNIDIDIDIEI
jgi:hypothetical protein